MSDFDWNDEKNEFLKERGGITFEDIVFYIGKGCVLDVLAHPNKARYPHQKTIVLDIEGYAYLI